MAVHRVQYLLIGGGLASSSAAQAIRRLDPQGTMALVAQEIVRPYHRPPLSKEFLRREQSREQIFTLGRDWFETNHVELRSGRRAVHLDVTRNTVTLDQGETIGYGKLLLAMGMTPRALQVPGANLPNLFYLRTLEDAEQLQKAVDKAAREGHPHIAGSRQGPRGIVAVVGSGFLGVELAASLTQMGMKVHLLCAEAHLWHRFAGETVGKTLAAFLETRGVRVRTSVRAQRLEGDGRVQRIVLGNDETISCDFAVAAIGAQAHRELLRNTPIEAETAILTDAHCQTNVADVFAAGDCAAIFDPLFGKHRLLDHWENAVETGKLAGQNMAGAVAEYSALNHFFSDVFDLTLNGWGESRLVDHRIVRTYRTANSDHPDLIEIGLAADGRVAQVLSVGHSGDDEILPSLVQRRATLDGLEERLKDPSIPLEAILKD